MNKWDDNKEKKILIGGLIAAIIIIIAVCGFNDCILELCWMLIM